MAGAGDRDDMLTGEFDLIARPGWQQGAGQPPPVAPRDCPQQPFDRLDRRLR